ncbi:kinase-like domain-containing protein, partial [Jimgerdemannia flammicorona]
LNHPGHEDTLRFHLAKLGLLDLADYLVWIPYESFNDVQVLGKGGFSTVYKAWLDSVDSRGFAVLEKADIGWKVGFDGEMKAHFALKEVNLKLIQEVVLSTYLAFCGVLSTIGLIGLSQGPSGHYLMIMDYAEEGSLEKRCMNNPPATHWGEIFDMARDMADRLYLLHRYGLVHKDLHPGNVVFRTRTYAARTGLFARLIDVGLSSVVESSQGDDGIYGRLPYLPIEVFDRQPYTSASDVYCFGTLMWQLVVGIPPNGTAASAVAERTDRMREEMIPGAPEVYLDLLRDCWQTDPARRPTMADILWRLYGMGKGSAVAEETTKWIEGRRAAHKRMMHLDSEESTDFEFFEMATQNLGSQFHPYKTFKVPASQLKANLSDVQDAQQETVPRALA